MRRFKPASLALCLFAALALPALTLPAMAQEKEAKPSKVSEQIEAATPRAPVVEQSKTTAHALKLAGKTLPYKATAGTLTLRDDSGVPIGSMFYVAYTAESQNGKPRPVTFFYNGGPGSASLWLHMGSFGPVIVKTNSPDNTPAAPYTLSPNENTILDKTDLVFLDAMGAGYSRPLGDRKASSFFGVDQDVDAFARAVKRYVNLNNRWNSPKYLFGESYGTTRTGALVNTLQEQGMDFNGIVLFSSILNYGYRQPGYDQIYISYLPSYAATAFYHKALSHQPADVESFVAEARAYASGDYAAALAKGTNISDAEFNATAEKLSYFTGLSVAYIKDAHLRVDLGRFRKELTRDRGVSVGRLDSRFVGIDTDEAGESPEFDPASTAITSAYYSSLLNYLSQDLGYTTDLEYRLSARGPDFKWDWNHSYGRQQMMMPNVGLDLGNAMRTNPHLKVLSLNGYYDMATPFYATEYDLSHMSLPKALVKNISYKYYPAGHMIYLHQPSLVQMTKDLDAYYDEGAK